MRQSSNGIRPGRTCRRGLSIDRRWVASSHTYVQHAFRGQIDGSISHPHASRAASLRRACGRQSFKNAPFRDFIAVSSDGESAAGDSTGDSAGRCRGPPVTSSYLQLPPVTPSVSLSRTRASSFLAGWARVTTNVSPATCRRTRRALVSTKNDSERGKLSSLLDTR